MSEKLRFIKPSLYQGEKVQTLTLERIKYNYENGITTNLIPDTNILITMEKCADIKVNSDRDITRILKEHNLGDLFNLFRSSPYPNFAWCPFFSLSEMPGKSANFCYKKLKIFDEKFKFKFNCEEDNITDNTFNKEETRKTINNMNEDQKLISYFSYNSLLLIKIIERDLKGDSFYKKIRTYLNIVVQEIDLISAKEFFIACIVFYSSYLKQNNGPYKNLIISIKENFVNGKKSKEFRKLSDLEKMKSIASNGAFDLTLINICNASDYHGFEGEKLDSWIVSFDKKLFNLVKYFPHIKNEYGESCFVYYDILLDIMPEHKNIVWEIRGLINSRKNKMFSFKQYQAMSLEDKVERIYFITNKFHEMTINGI